MASTSPIAATQLGRWRGTIEQTLRVVLCVAIAAGVQVYPYDVILSGHSPGGAS